MREVSVVNGKPVFRGAHKTVARATMGLCGGLRVKGYS